MAYVLKVPTVLRDYPFPLVTLLKNLNVITHIISGCTNILLTPNQKTSLKRMMDTVTPVLELVKADMTGPPVQVVVVKVMFKARRTRTTLIFLTNPTHGLARYE